MSNISKRDFLKTAPAIVPASLLSGLSSPALADCHEQQVTINNFGDFVYVQCPEELLEDMPMETREIMDRETGSDNTLIGQFCRSILWDNATDEDIQFCRMGIEIGADFLLGFSVAGRLIRAFKKLGKILIPLIQ